ncbi:hypothetical protein CVT24_003449 [Panaeolus cyanescens]|uniref:PX domain-containing protein n=1 Tax=Panaeolus cyanescens TaxID=181874 RepID=A0A409Y6T3_9AGAR|nr:hypothetical protein CVT24_003449 [Panaeolus cyanescens]
MLFSDYSGVGAMEPNRSEGENFKRAVIRPPPSRFTVDFLPSNYSGNHNYGMRISPISYGENSSITSRSRNVEYDIWRKWEDCLWFQDTLEKEYYNAAKEKKIRLKQGKGVKGFNGLYKADMASSWESLPPGPDPQSVLQDVHKYLPKLSKRGTVFRPSRSFVDERQKEFQNLVEALFSEDVPALIKEIRASTHVTDFFALWRRDQDAMEKSKKSNRKSTSSSVFSSYFSGSTQSLGSFLDDDTSTIQSKSLPSSPASKTSSRRSRTSSNDVSGSSTRSSSVESTSYSHSSKRRSTGSDETTSAPRMRRRAISNASTSDSSSIHSEGSSDSSSTASTNPTIMDESPLAFGHNPQTHQASDRPASILEVLPEELEMLSKTPENYALPAPRPRPRISSIERRANRAYSIVQPTSPRDRGDGDNDNKRSTIRDSWQSNASIDALASDILNNLGVNLPHPIKEHKFRASMASISTFMTTDSADAMFPHRFDDDDDDGLESIREGKPERPRLSVPLSLSDFDIRTEDDSFDQDSILDSFTRPSSLIYDPSDEGSTRSRTPTGNYPESVYTISSDGGRSARSSSSFEPPPSPTFSMASSAMTVTSTSTTSTSLAAAGLISIKAAHNSSIIMLKVQRTLDFADIRQRIYNKFVGQEGIPLSQSFKVAYVQGAPNSPVKGSGASSKSSKDRSSLEFIRCDSDWERLLLSTEGSKITLKILDAPQ